MIVFARGTVNDLLGKFTSRALYAFVKGNEFVNIDLGKPRDNTVVAGMMVGTHNDTATIMYKAPAKIVVYPLLHTPTSKSFKKIMLEYYSEVNQEPVEEVIEAAKELSSTRRIMMPMRVDNELEVREGYTMYPYDKACKVEAIHWKSDYETGKIKGYITLRGGYVWNDEIINKSWCNFKLKRNGDCYSDGEIGSVTNKVRIGFDEYGEFVSRASTREVGVKGKPDTKCIRLSDKGYYYPVAFENPRGDRYIVDSSFVYEKKDGVIDVVGIWRSSGRLEYIREEIDDWAMENLEANKAYIGKHRPMIAPYLTADETVINVF